MGTKCRHLLFITTLYNVCSVHRGMFQYIGGGGGGCSVHQGDTMSSLGGYHEYIGGYHDEYIGGCSVHRGFQ